MKFRKKVRKSIKFDFCPGRCCRTCNGVVESDQTSEDGCDVSNDGRQDPDCSQGNEEGQPAACDSGRRNQSENDL